MKKPLEFILMRLTVYVCVAPFRVPALGWAWTLFACTSSRCPSGGTRGSRENPKRGKCPEMPQNPRRPVHPINIAGRSFFPKGQYACPENALLGVFVLCKTLLQLLPYKRYQSRSHLLCVFHVSFKFIL
jgi:hypothetical protein